MSTLTNQNALETLKGRIDSNKCHIGIYGLGYVGLPLAMCFATAGVKVTGFDIDPCKIESIQRKNSYINSVTDAQLTRSIENGFSATNDFSQTNKLDALIICVPTPLDLHHQPDLSFITKTLDSILPYFKEGQLISLESTTWPGTTEEIIVPALESRGFIAGKNCAVVYSPEREDPGNTAYTTANIPKVIGGVSATCLTLGSSLYSIAINQMVEVGSTKVAEMSKLLENIHRAVNIGLVNEMKIVSDKMGINIHEVIQAASTKPFGFVPYHPGPGLGGHCIPIDPFYLTWKAKEFGINTRFIELAGEINHYMPQWVVTKVSDALNTAGKAINGSKILILGIAYKKNVDDTRESPAIEIMDQLENKGAEIYYSDPHVPNFPKKRRYNFALKSVELSESSLKDFDCIVLVTDHDSFDYNMIQQSDTIIVDTRNRLENCQNVTKA